MNIFQGSFHLKWPWRRGWSWSFSNLPTPQHLRNLMTCWNSGSMKTWIFSMFPFSTLKNIKHYNIAKIYGIRMCLVHLISVRFKRDNRQDSQVNQGIYVGRTRHSGNSDAHSAVVGSQWLNLMFTSMFLKWPASLHSLTKLLFLFGNTLSLTYSFQSYVIF